MCVVEVGCEAEEGYYGGQFVEDEKGCYMRDGSIAERTCILVKEGGQSAIETFNAGLRCGRGLDFGCIGSCVWFAKLQRMRSDAQQSRAKHFEQNHSSSMHVFHPPGSCGALQWQLCRSIHMR